MPAELGDNTCWKFINSHLIGLGWAADWDNVHGERGHHSDFIYKFIRGTRGVHLLVEVETEEELSYAGSTTWTLFTWVAC